MTFSEWVEVAAIVEFVFGLVAGAIIMVVQYRILLAITKLKKEIDSDIKSLESRLATDIKSLETSLETEVKKLRETMDDKLSLAQQRQDIQLERLRQEYSTQLVTLQAKVHDVEVKGLEMFVRRTSFSDITSRIEKTIDDIGRRMDTGLRDLTTRIDEAVTGRPHAAR